MLILFQELLEQINRHKENEQAKRERLNKYIDDQRKIIVEKEKAIAEK